MLRLLPAPPRAGRRCAPPASRRPGGRLARPSEPLPGASRRAEVSSSTRAVDPCEPCAAAEDKAPCVVHERRAGGGSDQRQRGTDTTDRCNGARCLSETTHPITNMTMPALKTSSSLRLKCHRWSATANPRNRLAGCSALYVVRGPSGSRQKGSESLGLFGASVWPAGS